MEFALSDTDGDSRRRNAFLYTFFIHLNDRKKKASNISFNSKIFNLP